MKVKIFSVNNPFRRKKQNQRVLEDEINKWLTAGSSVFTCSGIDKLVFRYIII